MLVVVVVVVLPQQVFEEGPAATRRPPSRHAPRDPGVNVNFGPLEQHPQL